MQKLSFYSFVIGLLSIGTVVMAQSDVDALRYSSTSTGGTARSEGVAGAFGALGADFSTLSINPAGLGLYRNSEFTITPALEGVFNESQYLGNTTTSRQYNFYFDNIGLVLSSVDNNDNDNGWVAFNFGGGFNRVADFHQHISFKGFNANNSILDRYVQDVNSGGGTKPANVYNSYPFGAGLAYDTWLISPKPSDSTQYYSEVRGGGVFQDKSIKKSGSITEWNLAFAANYDNKLYLGASLGIPFIRYEESVTYTESDHNDSIVNFERLSVQEKLNTEGEGVNLKMGLIYRAADWLRIGGSIQTPTYYSMHDDYSISMTSSLDTVPSPNYNNQANSKQKFDYNLYTPWEATASIGFIIGKYGFISADYTFRDYGIAFFDFSAGDASAELLANDINNNIAGKYGPTHNIRVGGEFRYEQFRLRAGYSLYESPFNKSASEVGANYARTNITAGFGIREDDYFLDFAFVRSASENFHTPYTLQNESTPGSKNSYIKHSFIGTIGLNF